MFDKISEGNMPVHWSAKSIRNYCTICLIYVLILLQIALQFPQYVVSGSERCEYVESNVVVLSLLFLRTQEHNL